MNQKIYKKPAFKGDLVEIPVGSWIRNSECVIEVVKNKTLGVVTKERQDVQGVFGGLIEIMIPDTNQKVHVFEENVHILER